MWQDTYCLLDTGSTSTFSTNRLASKLSQDGTATSLNLMTLRSYVSETADTIESIDHNVNIDMRSIMIVVTQYESLQYIYSKVDHLTQFTQFIYVISDTLWVITVFIEKTLYTSFDTIGTIYI